MESDESIVESEIIVTYTLLWWDLLMAQLYLCRVSRVLLGVKLLVYAVFTMTIVYTLSGISNVSLWSQILSGGIALIASMTVFNLFVWAVLVITMLLTVPRDSNSGILCEHTLHLTPTQLIEVTQVNTTHHHWLSVKRVYELRRHFLILFAGYQVHVIPKRAFETAEQGQNFFRRARQYWRATLADDTRQRL